MRFHLTFVSLYLLLSFSLAKKCLWRDPHTSKLFNLEPLISKKAPHKLEVSILGNFIKGEYLFNFCDGPKPKCHEQEVHVAEFMEFLGKENKNSCQQLGSLNEPTYRLFDQDTEGLGFSMTYTNQKSCMEFNRNTHHLEVEKTATTFNIHCHAGPTVIQKKSITARRCTQVFDVYSKAGCPGGFSKSNAQIFRDVMKILAIWLGVVCVLLIGFGLWVDQEKRLYKKLHIVMDKLKEGLIQARETVQKCLRRGKSNDGPRFSYSTIGKELQEI